MHIRQIIQNTTKIFEKNRERCNISTNSGKKSFECMRNYENLTIKKNDVEEIKQGYFL